MILHKRQRKPSVEIYCFVFLKFEKRQKNISGRRGFCRACKAVF
nr:MAG TPA: Protein of unknown function (DUF1244) [Caudoviricetes sp.]